MQPDAAANGLKRALHASDSTLPPESRRRNRPTLRMARQPRQLNLRAESHRILYRLYGNGKANSLLADINQLLSGQKCAALVRFRELRFWSPKSLVSTAYDRHTTAEQLRLLWNYYQFCIPVPMLAGDSVFGVALRFWGFAKRRREVILGDLLAKVTEANLELINIERVRELEMEGRPLRYSRRKARPAHGLGNVLEEVEPLSLCKESLIMESGEAFRPKPLDDDQTLLSVWGDFSGSRTSPPKQPRPAATGLTRAPNAFRTVWNAHYKKRVAAMPVVRVSMTSRDSRTESQLMCARNKDKNSLFSLTTSIRSVREQPTAKRMTDPMKATAPPSAPTEVSPKESQPINFLNFLQNYVDKPRQQTQPVVPAFDFQKSIYSTQNNKAKGVRTPLERQTAVPSSKPPAFKGLATGGTNVLSARIGRIFERTTSHVRPVGLAGFTRPSATNLAVHTQISTPTGRKLLSTERFSSRKLSREDVLREPIRFTARPATNAPQIPLLSAREISSNPRKPSTSTIELGTGINPAVRYEYFENTREEPVESFAAKTLFRKKHSTDGSDPHGKSGSRSVDKRSVTRKDRPTLFPARDKASTTTSGGFRPAKAGTFAKPGSRAPKINPFSK